MKPHFHSSFIALVGALVLGAGVAAHADYNDNATLASYADQLRYQGIRGPRFVQLVDQRYWRLNPQATAHPGNRGIGAYVLSLQDRGLQGRDLARAINAEQDRRWHAHVPPGQAKKQGPVGIKPKDKPAFFGRGPGGKEYRP